MGDVYFYHLTEHPMEFTLLLLLRRARDKGWRVLVRGQDATHLAWLDEKFWLGPEEEFLPHGLAGNPHEDLQPILLSSDKKALPNNPHCLIGIDGVEIAAQEVQDLERVCILFDGRDLAAVDVARTQWKDLTKAGCRAQYWSEVSGKWQKQAES